MEEREETEKNGKKTKTIMEEMEITEKAEKNYQISSVNFLFRKE